MSKDYYKDYYSRPSIDKRIREAERELEAAKSRWFAHRVFNRALATLTLLGFVALPLIGLLLTIVKSDTDYLGLIGFIALGLLFGSVWFYHRSYIEYGDRYSAYDKAKRSLEDVEDRLQELREESIRDFKP